MLVMDNLLASGSIALVKAAYTYFLIFEEKLLLCEDIGSLLVKLE
jgi:hypothetical protein